MVTWTEIQKRRWSREQQAIINDIAELEVKTLDFLTEICAGYANDEIHPWLSTDRRDLEELIKEYKERILG